MTNIEDLFISSNTTIREALQQLERTGLRILFLVQEKKHFERTITDGDLRRLLITGSNLETSLKALPKIKSQTILGGFSRREALDLMNENSIDHLPEVNQAGELVSVLHRSDIDEQILLSTPHIGSAEKKYVAEAFDTNWIAPLGPNVDAFEHELADMVEINSAAAMSSGTAAIHVGLKLLGVNPNDKVFCSTLTFAASANPIVYLGAEPVFIDSDYESWNMSVPALDRAFKAAKSQGWLPKAVIVVNIYGQSADMDPINELCAYYGVPVLEDSAESLGSKYKGLNTGTLGKIGVYSFNGNKIITTSGGGMLISNDIELIDRAKFLSTQARDPAPHYQHSEIGFNYRISNILAGVGRGQLKALKDRVSSRRAIFQRYKTELSSVLALEWQPEPSWSYSNRWLSVATLKPYKKIDAQTLIKKLSQELIEARPIWKPMHLQPIFSDCQYFTEADTSVSDDLFENGICLPSGSNMSSEQQQRVIETILRFC